MNERARTMRGYNLHLAADVEHDSGGMPTLHAEDWQPSVLTGFNYALNKPPIGGVHFFLDDYQFERVWNRPEQYVAPLSRFECVLSPDFSLYTDMPEPMQRWNVYRSRLLGAWWQRQGLVVIPTLQWSGPKSLRWAFDGLATQSTVAVSTVGVMRDPEARDMWIEGMNEAIARLEPSHILHYGTQIPDFDWQGTPVTYYGNDRLERVRENHGRTRI